jgi:hypothetical protein
LSAVRNSIAFYTAHYRGAGIGAVLDFIVKRGMLPDG